MHHPVAFTHITNDTPIRFSFLHPRHYPKAFRQPLYLVSDALPMHLLFPKLPSSPRLDLGSNTTSTPPRLIALTSAAGFEFVLGLRSPTPSIGSIYSNLLWRTESAENYRRLELLVLMAGTTPTQLKTGWCNSPPLASEEIWDKPGESEVPRPGKPATPTPH
ncbi:hypothetical protein GALMADRAFT_145164 [Galerina marginata CBS 339.88]|uniref:Uncharacterized protein n=1 Tax=Galerina marginata (strain CBS 339.88) TaxID=685588 RepID=A0A067SFS5_GALM3|nr:hypothetical protein GALMADRAFT_145164 [Galerina marginata CBS 339.88]